VQTEQKWQQKNKEACHKVYGLGINTALLTVREPAACPRNGEGRLAALLWLPLALLAPAPASGVECDLSRHESMRKTVQVGVSF
jgi:hypothetical protein